MERLFAPFTSEQVDAMNHLQSNGHNTLKLICPRNHGGQNFVMIARQDAMHCSIPSCDYKQNWGVVFD